MEADQDPIQAPDKSPRGKKARLNSGRFAVAIVVVVGVVAFGLYGILVLWAATGSP